jgi:predicted O-methyltransferase YrrM
MLSLGSDYGGMPSQDLYALLRVVGWVRPRKIFEIGTFHGATTAHLALNCDAEIYTLDLPREIAANLYGYAPRDLALLQPRQEIGRAYDGFNADGRIHQLFGDSRSFDYHPYLGRMDLILIDGCHVYDYVLSDSDKAFQLLSEAGAILWHDFGYSRDVTRVLRDLARRWPVAHVEGTGFGLYTRGVSLHHEFATSAVPAAQGVA